jgi:hypothetical protein
LTRSRRTGWLGRRDSNLCISKSDLLNFIPPRAAFQQARESPDVKQKLNAIGQAVSTESPAESIAALRAEAQLWRS